MSVCPHNGGQLSTNRSCTTPHKKNAMTRIHLRLALTMAVTWIILSALFKPQLLILGVMSVALVTWLADRAGVLHHRGQPVFIRVFEVLKYWAWLLLEILKSNISVTRILLDPSLPIKPVLRTVSAVSYTHLTLPTIYSV